MKRWRIGIVCLAVAALLCGSLCVAADDTFGVDLATNADSVKLLGRTTVSEEGIEPHTTGAGIAFYSNVSGTIQLTVTGSSSKFDAQCFAVYVDGVMQERVVLEHAVNRTVTDTLTVASGLEQGMHRVEIVRETEETGARCVFEELILGGDLYPVPDAPLLIEFVGDSLTCGYSALPQTDSSMSVEHNLLEAGTRTYAYLTAQQLGADFQSCCASGYGVVCGWNGDRVNLQDMYPYASYYHNGGVEWDFERKADVVVINLGTNDNIRMTANGKTVADIEEGIGAFTKQVKESNPDAKIVWATGLGGVVFAEEIQAQLAAMGGSEAGFYYVELPHGMSGGAGHPNLDEHAAAADVLTEFLKTNVLPETYEEDMIDAEEAARMNTKDLSFDEQEALALEIALAAKSTAMPGTLTGLCQTLELEPALSGGWIAAIVAAVVAAAVAIVVILVTIQKKKKKQENEKRTQNTKKGKKHKR